MKTITKRQAAILEFIRDFKKRIGFPPTRRDITDEFGFKSPNAAEEHLRALQRKGYLELLRNTSRGILLVEDDEANFLPVIGRVAAGEPVLSEQNIEEESKVSPSTFRPKADYLLRVQGDSMIDIGIHDGDLIAVQKTGEVYDNQIVVARLNDQVTVKRFYRNPSKQEIHLIPENEDFEKIVVDENSGDFEIEGLCVGLMRMRL